MYTNKISTRLLRSYLKLGERKESLRKWILRSVALLGIAAATSPAFAMSDNCPSVKGIETRLASAEVSASYTQVIDPITKDAVFTYTFSSNPSVVSSDGIPGLISYCVYPDKGNLPTKIAVGSNAVGADGSPFEAKMAAKGSFSFTRAKGNPTNIPLDGLTRTMGTATWSGNCTTDPITGAQACEPTAADTQTILLHINDTAECTKLYGTAGDTCWVYPGNSPPPRLCNGEPACKSADIDLATGQFDANGYPIVPLGQLLHIRYTYVIVNQPTNNYNMIFKVPTAKTQDINAGGGKDYFGCEQVPDPLGDPKTSPSTTFDYENTGMTLAFFPSAGNGCSQSRFQITAPGTITLTPGDSRSFTVDMITRVNSGGKQEFTSAGPHLLNSGFTVKWFQSNDSLLHSFTTGITPIYVNAQ